LLAASEADAAVVLSLRPGLYDDKQGRRSREEKY
jgi:hypothetical protein